MTAPVLPQWGMNMTFGELCDFPLLAGYVLILAVVLGAVFGSFLNCMAWRMVHHESVWKGRSHCATCGHPLKAADLVPVFSYLFLRGKCRYCGEKISPRYMIAELVSAGLWTACVLRFGLGWETVRAVALICVLFTLSLVDLESWRIPNSLIAAALVVYAVTFPFIELGLPGRLSAVPGAGAAVETAGNTAAGIQMAAVGAGTAGSGAAGLAGTAGRALLHSLGGGLLIGGGLLVLSVIFDRVTGREGLGGGDIKLFFAAGIYLGAAGGLLCVIVSCFVGLIFAGFRKNQKIPFGPAISIGIVLTMFFGDPIIRWYLGLL